MASSSTTAALLALRGSLAPADAQLPPRALVGAIESAVLQAQIRQQLPTRSSPAATSSEDTSDEQPPQAKTDARNSSGGEKKRKPTYYMRKEEMAQLQEELVGLETELKKSRRTPQDEAQSLVDALATNTGLQSQVRLGDLAIASAQSLIASYGSECRSSPIGGFIHLPKDPVLREQTLTRMKLPRMQEAIAYALTRSRFLNATKFTRQIDSFETDSGDFVTTHWEITPLEEARSVQQAFRELLYFTETQEMSMSEKLGVLTIRESESEIVDGTQTVRMLSKHDNGVQSESNLVVFSQYFEESEILRQPHALLVTDFVDEDDLYPRQPQTRIHKDVASMTMITEAPSRSHGGLPVVTMVRWAFIRVNNNPYTTRRHLEHIAREGVGKWCDVMLKCVRDRLTWHS